MNRVAPQHGRVQGGFERDGLQVGTNGVIGTVGNDWHIVGTGDFNGDSKSDILWRNDNGAAAIWEMNGLQVGTNGLIGTVGNDWHIVGTGDFNATARATSCGATTMAPPRSGK